MIDDDKTIFQSGAAPQASSQLTPEAKLICLDDSALPEEAKSLVVMLKDKEVTFGRGSDASVVLALKKVSRMHARVYPNSGVWEIEDLKSTNGVWINNKQISKVALASGDTVTIGSIPFRFELIKPVVKETSVPVHEESTPVGETDEKTLLFGELAASHAMIAACKKKDEVPEQNPLAKDSSARTKAKLSAPHAPAKAPAKKSPIKKLCVLLLLAAAIGGGGYYYTTVYSVQQAQQAVVKVNQSKIQNFVRDYEIVVSDFDYQGYSEEMKILDTLFTEVQQGLASYPTDMNLHNAEAIVTLLRLERQVGKLFHEKRDAEALALIDATKKELLLHNANASASDAKTNSDLPQTQEIIDLIDLLHVTSQYMTFSQKYPFPSVPSNINITPALKDEILRVRSLKKSFIELVKRNNRSLLITFKSMGGMVKYVDDQSLLLVEKWYNFAFKN